MSNEYVKFICQRPMPTGRYYEMGSLRLAYVMNFSCGSAGKESTCNAGDLGLIPKLGRSPGEGKGYPLQYSGLENSMDCIAQGVTQSQTGLNDFQFHYVMRGGALMKEIRALSKEIPEISFLLPPREGRKQEVKSLHSSRVCSSTMLYPELRLPAFRTVRNKYLVYKSPTQRYFVTVAITD